MPSLDNRDVRELRALEEIERNPQVSQRQLAADLGVALAVANACVHTLVRKGWIKVKGDSNRTITYHLTKEGLLHKSALAMKWTNNTLEFYSEARRAIRQGLRALSERDIHAIAVYGADEVAELVCLLAPVEGIRVVAVVDIDDARIADELAGVPVIDSLTGAAERPQAVLLASRHAFEAAEDVPDTTDLPVYDITGAERGGVR